MYLSCEERIKMLKTRLEIDPDVAAAYRKHRAGVTPDHIKDLDIADRFIQIHLPEGVMLHATAISKNKKHVFILTPGSAYWLSVRTVLRLAEQLWLDPRELEHCPIIEDR